MPDRRAAEAQPGNLVGGVLGQRDLVHRPGRRHRVRHLAADEPDDRRRRRHREAAEARRLGDRGVADVGVGVVRAVRAEVEAVRHARRAGEPAVAEPRRPGCRSRCRCGPSRRPATSPGRRGRRRCSTLAAAMPGLRKKWSLPSMKRSTSAALAGAASATTPGASSRSSSEVAARLRLCSSSPICSACAISDAQVDRPAPARPPPTAPGPSTLAHPAQPVEHLGAVRAVAQHLAQALVERAVGGAAVLGVAYHEHPHRRADHARHRADRRGGGGRAPAATCPAASSALGLRARRGRSPSSSIAPISAPRIGPDARSQVDAAGPACRNIRRRQAEHLARRPHADQLRPGGEQPADGDARWPRRRRGSARTLARAAAVPGSGGRQSTSVTRHGLLAQRLGQKARRRR